MPYADAQSIFWIGIETVMTVFVNGYLIFVALLLCLSALFIAFRGNDDK